MKPPPFYYAAPATVSEALSLLSEHRESEPRVLAGGQSLVPLMNFRLAHPTHVIDLNKVTELSFLRSDDGRLTIGAMTRQAVLERSAEVRLGAPLLAEAAGMIAHEPIRHRGTVGGSIAHADPAAELPAVALAMDAELVAASGRGERVIPATEFFLGPFTTALEPDEVLTEVRLPAAPGTGYAFVEFSRTHGNFALVGVAALLELDGDRIGRAALALCGAGPCALRVTEAERLLAGASPDGDAIGEAAEVAAAGLTPSSDAHASGEFKLRLTRIYVQRALETALARAQDRR
ncbi:MAG: xanthine dehydrogenase family protein subunit M [Pseudonocardiaceae bacterium]|nr:xanthine dehydrogenase family protein subunit M [Pseudonocardiaceae bacterium]